MGGISKVTEQFAVTVKSCHLCSHLKLHIISAKSKGMRTYRYTFYYKRKLKTVNFENINLNLIKLKTQIQMSRFLPHLRANLIASGSPFSEHLFPVCSTCPMNQFFQPESLCSRRRGRYGGKERALGFSTNSSIEVLLCLVNLSILNLFQII